MRYGFQPSPETVSYARNMLPADAEFAAIGVGKSAFTAVAQSYGGHIRVGLEDAVYLSPGTWGLSNAAMVEKARRIVEDLGAQIMTPREARDLLGLPTRRADSRAA